MIEASDVILSVHETDIPFIIEDYFETQSEYILMSYQLGMFLTQDLGLSRYLMDARRFMEEEDAQRFADDLKNYITKNRIFQFKITR